MNMNGPDFALPSSADPHQIFPAAATTQHLHREHGNPRQKRSKVIPIDDASSAVALASGSRTITKPKYSRKPDPGVPKITPPCSECGKTFWSWKALFGHMRCHPERQWRGINPPPNRHREQPSPPSPSFGADSFPVFDFTMTGEDHEVASSLILLANGRIAAAESQRVSRFQESLILESEESPEERNPDGGVTVPISCGRFECSSCKKVFGSHQALGGHRASHKNVKGCFAITRSTESEIDQDPNQTGVDQGLSTPKSSSISHDGGADHEKMAMLLGAHRCSICLRVFSSGQALGGHKRCHWDTKWEEPSGFGAHCGFDLNLPAPEDDLTVTSSESYSSGLTLDLRLGL